MAGSDVGLMSAIIWSVINDLLAGPSLSPLSSFITGITVTETPVRDNNLSKLSHRIVWSQPRPVFVCHIAARINYVPPNITVNTVTRPTVSLKNIREKLALERDPTFTVCIGDLDISRTSYMTTCSTDSRGIVLFYYFGEPINYRPQLVRISRTPWKVN